MQPDLNVVREARELLSRYFPATRLVDAPYLSGITGRRVGLKLETDLPTGTFKVRGALYTLALNLQRRAIREVVASSTGNHGAAVAYAAKLLGIAAKIFLPERANPVKRNRIRSLGAEIVEQGKDISEAFELAAETCARSPETLFLNDATDPDLPAGPGVMGLEILEQDPNVQAILVPMGDTALIRGVGGVVKQISPDVKIIGVQAERAPSYYRSWKSGHAVETDTCDTIADGLATRTPVQANVEAIREIVDEVMLVSDDEILQAISALLVEEHVVAEPAGAASTAALLKMGTGRGESTVLVVSGLNISREVLRRAIEV